MSATWKLDRSSLWGLEDYAREREAFRARVMAHKRPRRVTLNEHVTLYFEDALTIKYQVQEMLRAERIFEPSEIEDELSTYNPLIPDGHNWKATLMIEYEDPEIRRQELTKLAGVEHTVWVQIDDHERVFAIADEDLERSTEEKTSAVHFMRFELTPAMIRSLREGAAIAMGIDHSYMPCRIDEIDPQTRVSLLADLTGEPA